MPQLKVTYPEDLEGKDGFVSLGKVSGSGPWVPWVASGGRKWWEQHVIFIWLLLLLLFCPYYRLSVFLWYWHLFPAKAHKHSTEVVQIILRNDGTRAWPEDLSVAPIHHLRCINPQYDQLGMMLWPLKKKMVHGTVTSFFAWDLQVIFPPCGTHQTNQTSGRIVPWPAASVAASVARVCQWTVCNLERRWGISRKRKKIRENETYEIRLFSEGLHNFFSHFFVFHFLDCFFSTNMNQMCREWFAFFFSECKWVKSHRIKGVHLCMELEAKAGFGVFCDSFY